jgi:hypothetical protein
MTKQHNTWSQGELFLRDNLQKPVKFILGNKALKTGRLLLFKKNHFFIQLTLLNEKQQRENFEIPFPFKLELYKNEGLVYFDYRMSSLNTTTPLILKKVSSSYFNKILEVQFVN